VARKNVPFSRDAHSSRASIGPKGLSTLRSSRSPSIDQAGLARCAAWTSSPRRASPTLGATSVSEAAASWVDSTISMGTLSAFDEKNEKRAAGARGEHELPAVPERLGAERRRRVLEAEAERRLPAERGERA
jgi:hypothetical protein